jgi:hypothetical protein
VAATGWRETLSVTMALVVRATWGSGVGNCLELSGVGAPMLMSHSNWQLLSPSVVVRRGLRSQSNWPLSVVALF